jgi:inosine-uridine nucleoside N-ribohydrolase
MVGLDVCYQPHLYPSQVEKCASHGTPLVQFVQFVQASSAPWFQIMAGASGSGYLHLYDSLAVAVAMDTSLVTLEDSYVEIEVGAGPAQGMSVSYHTLSTHDL